MSIRVGRLEYVFTHESGEVVSAAQVLRLMRLALDFTGLDGSHYGGHGFRIVHCTEWNATEVKVIGRWQLHAMDLDHKPAWLVF